MEYYFSPKTGFFYVTAVVTELPDDAITLTDAQYEKLIDGLANGCGIAVSHDGPALTDPAQVTHEISVSIAENTKSQLIASSMQSISVVQLKLQAGRALTDAERNILNSTLDYIDAVTAINTENAPAITWPTAPATS